MTGAGEYELGQSFTAVATPEAAWVFKNWVVANGSDVIVQDVNSASTQMTVNSGESAEVYANFELQFDEYSVSVRTLIGEGTTTGAGYYNTNEFSLSATPASGYVFKEWRVRDISNVEFADAYSANTTATITWSPEARIDAVFEKIEVPSYSLSIQVSGNGSVTGAGSYDSGELFNVNAIADAGWIFKNWTVQAGSVLTIQDELSAATQMSMNSGDATVWANFEEEVQSTCSGIEDYVGGSAYVTGNQVVQAGNLYECRAWPNGLWCASASYEPQGVYGSDAWDLVSSCN